MDTSDKQDSSTVSSTNSTSSSDGSVSDFEGDYSDINFNPDKIAYHHRLATKLDSSDSKIREVGKKATNTLHPDQDARYAREDAFISISEARKTLSDPDLKSAYQLFCLNFGCVEGTKRFETWRNRGRPRSAVVTVKKQADDESLAYRPLSELTDHLPLEKNRGEIDNSLDENTNYDGDRTQSNSTSPVSNPTAPSGHSPPAPEEDPTSTPTPSPSSEPSETEPSSESSEKSEDSSPHLHTGDQINSSSIGGGVEYSNIILEDYVPVVVEFSGDDDNIDVVSMTYAGVDYLEIKGFVPGTVLLFNISKQELSTETGDLPSKVDWSERLGQKQYVFEYNNNELVIELKTHDEIAQSRTDSFDSGEVNSSKNQSDTPTPSSQSNQSSVGVIDMVSNILEYLRYTTSIKTAVFRSILTIVWFVVGVSSYLTPLGAAGWTVLLVPLRKSGVWVLSIFTIYYITPLEMIGYLKPTGNISFTVVLCSLIAATVVSTIDVKQFF